MEAGTIAPDAPPAERKPDEPELDGTPTDEEPAEPTLHGTVDQLSLTGIGGSHPDESKITLAGGELPVLGQFRKGERVKLILEGVVDEVALRDKRDRKTGTVTATIRKHTFTIESAYRLAEDE